MTTPETLSPREIAARKLRERLRISVGPNARAAAEAGLPVALSGTEADEAVFIVLDALAKAGMVLTDFSRCSCRKTPLDYEGPERDCPIHGEPEVMLAEVTAERDSLQADLNVTRGMLAAARRHAGENPADLVGKVAKTLGRDWAALPDWELRAAARFTLAAIDADGKVVVDRADFEAVSAIWDAPEGDRIYTDEELDAASEALTRLRAALADQQNGATTP